MNHSEVRKFLKKGEQAVDVLESLGYTYVANGREHPHWVAPVNPLNDITKAIEELVKTRVAAEVKDETAKAYLAGEASGRREADLKGPEWNSVKDLKGLPFSVMLAKIPSHSKLSGYSSVHFTNRQFNCLEIRYHRSAVYTGYAVLFSFPIRPFHPETVWLPLSACVFRR